jgi:glycerol-3-phosphate dehydrogenase
LNISVLGCGRWGSFLAWYLGGLGHRVMLYGRPGPAICKSSFPAEKTLWWTCRIKRN